MGADHSAKSVKWVEGLRGIASFLVILTHLARAWDHELFYPTDWDHEHHRPYRIPRLLQLPILRLPWQGRVGVTIFAFLTGFVCALKPLKLARQGNHSSAFDAIAKSAFRRPPRLVLPATIAMLIAWTLAQLGGFKVGNRADSEWIRYASPMLEPTFKQECWRLLHNFRTTWTTGYMAYDDHQWALLPLLKGSFTVYISLFATMKMQFRWRMLFYILMYGYFWQNNHADTETFGMQMFYGMFLCDLANHPGAQNFISGKRWLSAVVSPLLIFLGLYLGSYPDGDPARVASVPWCRRLLRWSAIIFPADVNLGKRWTAVGVDLIILGIWLSPAIKDFLSNKFLMWLGKNSFAVYLTHGTMLRTVLVWMIYGITGEPFEIVKVEQGKIIAKDWLHPIGPWSITFAIPIWIGLVYVVAYAWTEYVDSWCAAVTQKLESKVFEEDEKDGSLLLA